MSGRRVTIVASELLGRAGTGGAGTADSLLAIALGRHGHRVQLVVASGREIGPLNETWLRRYEEADVEIRVLERMSGISPPYLTPALEVFHALRDDPPEIVIANEWRGLGFLAQRAREAGLALSETAFVVQCHSPGRVLAEFAQKVPDTLDRFGEDVMERTSIALADAVVSPSAWLLDWMRAHQWPVPESACVIQYLRQSAALDETPVQAPTGHRVRRLAFFGQLREGKGIRLLLAALNELDPTRLDDVELLFLGSERGRWTSSRVLDALSPRVREHVSEIRFEPRLDRDAALDELRRPGTLAIMPSLLDNSPNTVSECIESGIPFIATATGGLPELVAEKDRARVLCAPESGALTAALTRALESDQGFEPARHARDPQDSASAWLELVAGITPAPRRDGHPPSAVAVVATREDAARRARRLAERTQSVDVDVVEATSRREGLFATSAEWIVFLDGDDIPDDGMLDAFARAQAASGADIVTAAVRSADQPADIRLFLGDPGPLGLVENQYGVLGLIRSSLAVAGALPEGGADPDWPLLARLTLRGAKIVSLPEPLSQHAGRPGKVGDVPGEGLRVLESFEENGSALRDLPQLAATLGATLARPATAAGEAQTQPVPQRLRRRIARLRRVRRPG